MTIKPQAIYSAASGTRKFTPCSWSFQTHPSKVCLKDQCTKIISKPFSLILSHPFKDKVNWRVGNRIHWMTLVVIIFFSVYTRESCISSHYCSFSFKHNLHKEEFIQQHWVNLHDEAKWQILMSQVSVHQVLATCVLPVQICITWGHSTTWPLHVVRTSQQSDCGHWALVAYVCSAYTNPHHPRLSKDLTSKHNENQKYLMAGNLSLSG